MSIKTIEAINCQAIKGAVSLELPETGLIRFLGENNNGKSILIKILFDIIRCNLHMKEIRLSYINWYSDDATYKITKYNGDSLLVYMHKESSKTYYVFEHVGDEPLKRYLSDKNLDVLITKFGFHYDKTRDISLNIYNTYDPLLFVTTSPSVNYDILNCAIVDKLAEDAIEAIDVVLLDLVKEGDIATKRISEIDFKLSQLKTWDIDYEDSIRKRCRYLSKTISLLKTPTIPEYDIIPDIGMLSRLNTSKVRKSLDSITIDTRLEKLLNTIKLVTKYVRVTDMENDLIEYNSFMEDISKSICPECKQPMIAHGGEHTNE